MTDEEFQRKVDECLDWFDWSKCNRAMRGYWDTKLMQRVARNQFEHLRDCEGCISRHGITVSRKGDTLSLAFELASWSTRK